eukprot:UN1930
MRRWRSPRFALISFSDRPALSALTRPSLIRFSEAHPGRYDLLLEQEPILDTRDFHPAWNKLAYARRAIIMGGYDAIICMDDDILITDPARDPLQAAIIKDILPSKDNARRLVLASLDEHVDDRVPLNTGVLALRSSLDTVRLLDELFLIARRLEVRCSCTSRLHSKRVLAAQP